jgi:hypothetical protein
MVLHRTPVAVRRPDTGQHEGMHRGLELPDAHPFCTDPAFAWLFEDSPEPAPVTSVSLEPAADEQPARRGRARKADAE